MRESWLAAAIDHPNIIPIYEADEVGGLLDIVMRYVDGSDLKQVIERGGRSSWRGSAACCVRWLARSTPPTAAAWSTGTSNQATSCSPPGPVQRTRTTCTY
jgi:serine/threonine protein kinase